jgi:hypothetical protein
LAAYFKKKWQQMTSNIVRSLYNPSILNAYFLNAGSINTRGGGEPSRKTYSEKGALQEYHWAYILPQEAFPPLHNNSPANLPISHFSVDLLLLLLPVLPKFG